MTTPALTITITSAGQAAFTAAQLAGAPALAVTAVAVTDAAFVVAPSLTALPGEARRLATISGEVVDSSTIHLIVRDDDPDASYGARGFGLFLNDGTLFAVYGQPGRVFEKSTQSSLLVALDLTFPTLAVDHITFGDANFLNPPATERAPGVIELATQAEVEAGDDPSRAVTPKTLGVRLAELAASLLATLADTVADYVPLAQRGQAGGVATLGGDGLVPLRQLPIVPPIGAILLWAGAAAPTGWAICDGSTVQRSDGTGPITTPDLRGRVPVGASDDHALGAAFGQAVRDVSTASAETGITLNATAIGTYAGGGTQAAIASPPTGAAPSLTDTGHHHDVSVDVTQPSLALHFIMRV